MLKPITAVAAAFLILIGSILGEGFVGSDVVYLVAMALLYVAVRRLFATLTLVRRLLLILLLLGALFADSMLLRLVLRPPSQQASSNGEVGSVLADSGTVYEMVRGYTSRSVREAGLDRSSNPLVRTLGGIAESSGAVAGTFLESVSRASSLGMDRRVYHPAIRVRTTESLPGILLTILAAAISVLLVANMRGLVLTERRRGTLRMYHTLIVLVFIHVAYVALGLERYNQIVTFDLADSVHQMAISVPYILVVLWGVVNGFRNKWIHYLSRGGKYLAAVGSVGGVFLSLGVQQMYQGGQLTVCSASMGALAGSVATVMLIYSGMSLLAILLHLPTAKLLDAKLKELRSLQSLSKVVYSTFDEKLIASRATELCRQLTGAERSWLYLAKDGFERWGSAGGRSAPESEWVGRLDDSLKGEDGVVLLNNLSRSEIGLPATEGVDQIGSLMAGRLSTGGESMGILMGASRKKFSFMEEQRALFASFCRQVTAALENARLVEASIERERYREELNLARRIQQSLLPSELPEIEGFDMYAASVSSNQVGGDYYDVIPLSDGRYAITVADVAGKGAGGALLMSALQATLSTLLAEGTEIDELVARLNRHLESRMPADKFVTCFLAFLDPKSRRMSYCNAGHNPPILVEPGGEYLELKNGGLVIGVMRDVAYRTGGIVLSPGSKLVLYTDGITETVEEDGEQEFGRDRLRGVVRNHIELGATELAERIFELVDSFRGGDPQRDDMTLLVLSVDAR
ncbi:SpoIIE family protein phosphatase [Candidatus Fermentibacteria bacterium]|nr:SpoIIE family protein phosphatase [Candidatus Fermentibacteria bacterium]